MVLGRGDPFGLISPVDRRSSAAQPINGGTVVAEWSNGRPLIVRGIVKNRNRVDVNLYPPQNIVSGPQWSGNHVEIIRNALLF